MIRECYNVISEFPVGFIGFGRPIFALVQDALYARMRMKIGSFPAYVGFPPRDGLKMSGPLKGLASLKSYTGLTLVTKIASKAISMSETMVLPNATNLSQHVNQSSFIWMQCVSHKLMAEDNCCKVNKNAARAKGKMDV